MAGREGGFLAIVFFNKLAICFEFLVAKSRKILKKIARFHPDLQQIAKNKEGCKILFFYFYIFLSPKNPCGHVSYITALH